MQISTKNQIPYKNLKSNKLRQGIIKLRETEKKTPKDQNSPNKTNKNIKKNARDIHNTKLITYRRERNNKQYESVTI